MDEYRKASAYYVIMWSQTPLQLLFHLVQIAKRADFLELNRILKNPMANAFISTKKKKRKDAVLSLRSSFLKRDRRRRVA